MVNTIRLNHAYSFPGGLLLFLGLFAILSGARPAVSSIEGPGHVLAYATAMSRWDLHAAENASRSANGLPPLTSNAQLKASAQAKAEHMIANNYWAHVAPDGTQPWYFFDLVGYSYIAAGENLAYGFNTGYEVNTSWMNSPLHRANVLGAYFEVGYGIANGAAFQGGEYTVVVAHYGTQQGGVVTPAPPEPEPPASTAHLNINNSGKNSTQPAAKTDEPKGIFIDIPEPISVAIAITLFVTAICSFIFGLIVAFKRPKNIETTKDTPGTDSSSTCDITPPRKE